MKIKIEILNPENINVPESNLNNPLKATWHSRLKTYECDQWDDDIKNCTVSHFLEEIQLDDIRITSKNQIDNLIEFLENAKGSLKY